MTIERIITPVTTLQAGGGRNNIMDKKASSTRSFESETAASIVCSTGILNRVLKVT